MQTNYCWRCAQDKSIYAFFQNRADCKKCIAKVLSDFRVKQKTKLLLARKNK